MAKSIAPALAMSPGSADHGERDADSDIAANQDAYPAFGDARSLPSHRSVIMVR